MRKHLRWLVFLSACCAVLMIAGCGGGGGGGASESSTDVSGRVVQGQVKQELVFADRDGDKVLDADEAAAYTDKDGNYSFKVPYEGFLLVTEGIGVDVLSAKTALPMAALPTARNITLLTSLVASLTSPQDVVTKLESVGEGQPYDMDISTGVAPLGYVRLCKAVEMALRVLENAGVNDRKVQLTILKNMGEKLRNEPDLSNDDAVASALGEAVAEAAPEMRRSDLEVLDIEAMKNAIANAVRELIQAIEALPNGSETAAKQIMDDIVIKIDMTSIFKKVLVSVESVTLRDNEGNVLATLEKGAKGCSSKATMDQLKLRFSAVSNFEPTSYENLSLVFIICDQNSERVAIFEFNNIYATVYPSGIQFMTQGARLKFRGVTSFGNPVTARLDLLSTSQIFSNGSEITIGLGAIQQALSAQATELEEVAKPGQYDVVFTLRGVSAVPMGGILTVQP